MYEGFNLKNFRDKYKNIIVKTKLINIGCVDNKSETAFHKLSTVHISRAAR